VITGFIRLEPSEGSPASRKTEVRILFGEDDLFAGARMHDDHEAVENILGRRDEFNRADWEDGEGPIMWPSPLNTIQIS